MGTPARPGYGQGGSAGPQLVLINGLPGSATAGSASPISPSISPLDRGLHFGDGLFETIACRQGRARFLSLHMDRLASSCQRLHIAPGDLAIIRREVEQAAAGSDCSLIKLMLTRGEAVARGYGWAGRETATRVLLRYAWPAEDPLTQQDGVQVRVAGLRLGENPALAGMKHLNRLEQVLARSEVSSQDAPELLLFSHSGKLVSGTMSNVFIVRDGQLLTPRLNECGIAGIMRRVVLREAERAGMAAQESILRESDLEQAHEVFLTNARIGIWPVSSVGSRDLAVGPVTRRLQGLIAPLLENAVDA